MSPHDAAAAAQRPHRGATTAHNSTPDLPTPEDVPMTSAYPVELTTLIERVRAHAVEHGTLPTQNRIMNDYKVGRPKAAAVLAALTASGITATAAGAAPTRRLHAVSTDPQAPVSTQVTDPSEAPSSTPATLADEVPDTPAPAEPGAVEAMPAEPAPVDLPVQRSEGGPGWRVRSWPLLLLALGAFVSIWGGWVGLGELTGFGPIRLLPGIVDGWVINSAITLPIGVEAYAAFALRVWLTPPTHHGPGAVRARTFARRSAIGALLLGMTGQIAYHLMTAAQMTRAPWPITAFVSALPVVVLGCGAALAHLTTHASHAEREVR